MGTAVVLGSIRYAQPLRVAFDDTFGNSVWDQPGNYRQRGLALHLVQESVRTAAKVGRAPGREAVEAALAGRELHAPLGDWPRPLRNVHMIVLESFFDPTSLGPELVPEDPFSPDFRALWEGSGASVALSPVFGGYTANAEFESLWRVSGDRERGVLLKAGCAVTCLACRRCWRMRAIEPWPRTRTCPGSGTARTPTS